MNRHDILGASFGCECGKTHTVAMEHLVYARDAISRMPAVAAAYAPGRHADLVADVRTYAVAGNAVEEALTDNGWTVHTTVIPDPIHGDPVCSDVTRDWLETQLSPSPCLLVAVGAGVISDLCKWVAAEGGIPYITLATAASMNGYASENIAPAIKGVKRVISGTLPKALFAVPHILAEAPGALTAAGFGDVLAKPVSMADWHINHILFDEYYCPFCAALIRDLEPMYMDHPERIRAKEPVTLRALFDALVYSGISMTMAHTSFPASGGEHLVSHVLDMTAMRDKQPHDYHGRQVGVGTVFASALYDRLIALETPSFRLRLEHTDADYWSTLTDVVEEEHAGKRDQAARAVERLRRPGMWEQIRAIAGNTAIGAARVKQCLAAAGAAHTLDDIGCSRETFIAAARHCHQIRARYTVVDLARAAGILPDAIEAIVDEYLV